MKHINLVQKYLSNLAVLNIKLHNIHWNVVGKQFVQVHNFTEDIYNALFENLDEVAELLKMKEIMPISTVKGYLENTSISEIDAKDFGIEEALKIVLKDLEDMKTLAVEIRHLADEEGDFETVAIFEGYVAHYSKNIWFLKSMLK